MPPAVAHSPDVDLQPEFLRPELPDSPSIHPAYPVGSLYMTVDIDRLVEIEITAGAVAEGMENMVSVLDSKTREHHALLISLAVAIMVPHIEKVRRVGDIGPIVVIGDHPGGHQQTICKDR